MAVIKESPLVLLARTRLLTTFRLFVADPSVYPPCHGEPSVPSDCVKSNDTMTVLSPIGSIAPPVVAPITLDSGP